MVALLGRDIALVFAAKFLRTFVYGILTVSLVIYLAKSNFSSFEVGLVLSVAILGGVFSTLIVSLLSDRYGRRRTLTVLSLLMGLSGLMLASFSQLWMIAVALFIGSVSLTGGEIGPFLSIEQSILPQLSSAEARNRAFSAYNFIGYLGLSLGSLAGIVPNTLEQSYGFSLRNSYLPVFLSLSMAGVILAVTYQRLGWKVEVSNSKLGLNIPRTSRRVVLKLSALFGLDSFGGGFVLQSFISYWFYRRFGVGLNDLSLILVAGQATTAVSILLTGRVADRFGLLNTMVFTHMTSNLLLASIAFAPVLPWAVGLYLARQSLSQMDVPTRQAYTMALVPEDERTPAAGITTLSRNVTQSVSPTIAGYLLQSLPPSLGAPFILAGSIKIAYDLLIYRSFRRVTIPDPPAIRPEGLGRSRVYGQEVSWTCVGLFTQPSLSIRFEDLYREMLKERRRGEALKPSPGRTSRNDSS